MVDDLLTLGACLSQQQLTCEPLAHELKKGFCKTVYVSAETKVADTQEIPLFFCEFLCCQCNLNIFSVK